MNRGVPTYVFTNCDINLTDEELKEAEKFDYIDFNDSHPKSFEEFMDSLLPRESFSS